MGDTRRSIQLIFAGAKNNRLSQQVESPILDLKYVNRKLALHESNPTNRRFSLAGLPPAIEIPTSQYFTPTSNLQKSPNIQGQSRWRCWRNRSARRQAQHDTADDGTPASTSCITSTFPRVVVRRRTEIIVVSLLAITIAIATFCATTYATASTLTTTTGSTQNTTYGQYQGVSLPSGITQYLGVRYAAPAVRFAAPQPPQSFEGVHIADTPGPGCIGAGTWQSNDSEDCLFADIFAPTSATPKSRLPVYVFIQGGGLQDASAHFNGTGLIQKAENNSLVVVSFAYRTGPFGFLASQEVQQGGSLNIGYLDQYQLLQWVNKEIAQFGGDPSHVTLGGQSAGAGSVVGQLTARGGVDQGLFQAALIESQSMTAVRNVSDQQFQYDNIVQTAGCQDEKDTLSCLRSLSPADLLKAAVPAPFPGASQPPVFQWAPVVDGDFVRDVPASAMARGNFIKVPTIFGDVTDEGSIFTPRSIDDVGSARTFIQSNWPTITSSQLDVFNKMYDFNDTTPDSEFWTRASQAYGETRYTCPGQHLSNLVSQQPELVNKVWNWRYNVATQANEEDGVGASHGSELSAIWGTSSSAQQQLLGFAQGIENVVNPIQDYWLSFIQTHDPNTLKSGSAPTWTPWSGNNRVLFNLNGTTMETVPQDQLNRCGFLAKITISLRQ